MDSEVARELRRMSNEYLTITRKIQTGMGWSELQTDLWMLERNPHLENRRPMSFITTGKAIALAKWVMDAIESPDPKALLSLKESREKPIMKNDGPSQD